MKKPGKGTHVPSDSVANLDELVCAFESLPDGVIVIVEEGMRITAANNRIKELLKMPTGSIVGYDAKELLKNRCPALASVVDSVTKTGKGVRNFTLEVAEPAGEANYFLTTVSFIREIAPSGRGLVVMLHDISDAARARESAFRKSRYGELIGEAAPMRELFGMIRSVSPCPASILITGETGTGKELVARTIHGMSERRHGPFVPVHCAALSDTLIESELFGHVKGAFTGASAARTGRFVFADGGTLFLDEVGTLNASAQTKLLRAVQERVIEPVGSSDGKHVDVRIVSATNRDLTHLIAEGSFREDLYYRLNVVQICVPPLRERREDIPLLTDFFIERLRRLYHRGSAGISGSARELLMRYSWPGNVRELENAIEHAIVLAKGPDLEPEHFPEAIRHSRDDGAPPPPSGRGDPDSDETKIRTALLATDGDRAEAARLLGIHRSTLWQRMREFRIDRRFGKP
jgi:transcriptional regulator with PAS, ATPase and Fis domain